MVVLKVIVWNSSNFNISNCDRKIVMTVAIIEERKTYHNSIIYSKSSRKIS